MDSYEMARKIYNLYENSGKRYTCLNEFDYDFKDEYDKKYELCTNVFDVILAYLKVYDFKKPFAPQLLTKLGYSGASMIEVKPPFSLYNNAVFIWLGQQLFYYDEAEVIKTKTGYNDNSEPIIKVYVKYNMNPMSLEAIGWCLKLAFSYNKPIQCGVYGVLFG
ncbi:lipothrixviral structural protein [Sulfolobus islandicus filamentous virus 2]|uniref:Lipothrixviral structural protein n=1 Tax=Sulfolobus islandicus filamentous virus 2 TaxID=1902331 RepID=A0A1D8BJ90_SIFV|nr:lipothrixviral structural protein [Sulfolobus islandicus filamentous virus 2]